MSTDPFFGLDYASDFLLHAVELQQVFETPQQALVLGVRYQAGSVGSRSVLTRGLSGVVADQSVSGDLERFGLYAYENWRPSAGWRVTLGLAYESLDYPLNLDVPPLTPGQERRSQLSPKLGLTWDAWRGGTFRGMWARSLGGMYFDDAVRIEPTQVAGFVSAYRSLAPESVVGIVPGTAFESWGVGFDQALRSGTHFGVTAEWLRSDGSREVGAMENSTFLPIPDTVRSTRQDLDFQERSVAVYAGQLLGRGWAAGVRYRLGAADLTGRFPELPAGLPGLSGVEQDESSVLHQVRLFLTYNHPTGFFGEVSADWYGQSNRGYTPDRPGEAFWQENMLLGYRLARRHAELRVGVLNLGDQDYRLNPLSLYGELMRGRTFVASLRVSF